ncbi:hypothetical protein NMG60_11018547, partial [Bertholletia excelsa]
RPFGEASKEFIDFLFTLLALPVGAVVRLLKKQGTVGCLANLYERMETLSHDYLQKNLDKDFILNPRYMGDPRVNCPFCKGKMSREMNYVAATVAAETLGEERVGFVKGVVTYMVMGNLVVKPMSTISNITMLNKFNVKDVGSLEERVVDLDIAAGLKLLKASLHWNTVLTCVFLEG